MHYFMTGHTGFKGAWLTLWLTERGHSVSGLSLDPVPGSLFERADLSRRISRDVRCDIRDTDATRRVILEVRPDVIVHLAAQPLVRESYRSPRTTFETNVLGTMNILEATQHMDSVAAQLIVTTDKVYRNVNKVSGYAEDDPLGGDDPYSASKAMADILTASWVRSFPGPPTAVARAGNVIGGGDSSEDRLVPDLVRAFAAGLPAAIRYPDAVRPWQHVLDCLNGYLLLIDRLLQGEGVGPWNFGPTADSFATVRDLAERMAVLWGQQAGFVLDETERQHEAALLTLDSSKARVGLPWTDRLKWPAALEWTVDWERATRAGVAPGIATLEQIGRFEGLPA